MAAELAVPDKRRLMERQEQLSSALELSILRRLESEKNRLRQLRERPVLIQAKEFTAPQRRHLDYLKQQLLSEIKRLPREASNTLLPLQHRLSRPLEQRLARESNKVDLIRAGLDNLVRTQVAGKRARFERLLASLDALSPLSILARGYNLTYSKDNHLVSSVAEVRTGDEISVFLNDGSLLCDVREIVLHTKEA